MLQEHTLFDNRYELLRRIGQGGFAEVWLASDNWTKLQIAIKIYAPGQGMDTDGLMDFSQELAGVYNLNHSNLLKPQHVDAWEGRPYLIMAYCANGSLKKRIGHLSETEIWKVIGDIASGLAYLHQRDIVHQDIKPDNILIDDQGNYLITDFGISAKARNTLRKSTIGGAVSGGTMAYMGPERFSKQPAPTKASDIWSLGSMVFELITGDVPFGELGGGMQRGNAEVPEITEPVSDELKQLVYQMLSPETWDRPTAKQLIERCRHAAAGKPQADVSNQQTIVNNRQTVPCNQSSKTVTQSSNSDNQPQTTNNQPQSSFPIIVSQLLIFIVVILITLLLAFVF